MHQLFILCIIKYVLDSKIILGSKGMLRRVKWMVFYIFEQYNRHMNKFGFLLSLFILFFFSKAVKSQVTMHSLIHAGYQYQNHNFGELGARFLFLNNDDVLYRVGGSALLGSVNDETVVLPKIQGDILLNFQRGVDLYHSYYYLLGAEVTPKYIAPKVGFSLFGIIDLTGGYGFSLDKNGLKGKDLEGLNLSFTVNLPLVMLKDLLGK